MNVVPAHLQDKPHQERPMRTASKILRRLVDGGLPATASVDEGVTPDPILSWPLPAYRRDERRIARHDNGVAASRKIGTKPLSNRCGQLSLIRMCGGGRKFLGAHGYAGHGLRIRSTKNPPTFIRRRKVPWRFFVREIALPHIDLLGQGTLPSPTAGCRTRSPESLLMLNGVYKRTEATCQIHCRTR